MEFKKGEIVFVSPESDSWVVDVIGYKARILEVEDSNGTVMYELLNNDKYPGVFVSTPNKFVKMTKLYELVSYG